MSIFITKNKAYKYYAYATKIIATVVDCMTALVKLIDIKNFSAGNQKNERSILSVSIRRRNAI